MKHKLIDKNRIPIRINDIVKVIGIPDLSGMSKECIKESLPIFKYLCGKTKKVTGIDKQNGLIELSFRILKGKNKGLHSIFIEAFLLEKNNDKNLNVNDNNISDFNVIVERKFEKNKNETIVVQIGKPYEDPKSNSEDYCCPYRFLGFEDDKKIHFAYGVDSLQALILAIDKIAIELKYIYKPKYKLTWLEQNDLGIPVISKIECKK